MGALFISYASDDHTVALQVCTLLEAQGIRCWIAPRDVEPGAKWDEAIVDAIDASSAFLLVLTVAANKSPYVSNEVNHAFAAQKPIFTFRAEDVQPSKSLGFYLARNHWTDGFPAPIAPKLAQLAAAVNGVLHRADSVTASAVTAAASLPKTSFARRLGMAVMATASVARHGMRNQPGRTLAATFLLGGAIAAGVLWALLPPFASSSPLAVSRLRVDLAPADEVGGPEGRPVRTAIALSPDGRTLVFSALLKQQRQLFARNLADAEATPLPGTEGAMVPFFSPDGRSVGFWVNNELRQIPLAGGPPQTIATVGGIASTAFGASWGADDRIVFARIWGGLAQVASTGGTPEPLTVLDLAQGEVSHRLPHVLPDGDGVLFTVMRNRFPRWDETQIVLWSRRDGTRTLLVEGGADARYVPSGHLVYARQGVLMGVPFDLATRSVSGKAVAVTADLMQSAYHVGSDNESGAGQFSVSANGTLVYAPGGVVPEQERGVLMVDRAGRVRRLPIPPRPYGQTRLSPDGQRAALFTNSLNWDIWVADIARESVTRLTSSGRNATPIWTPDGARIVYRSSVTGPDNLFRVAADGTGRPERLTTSVRNQVPGAWSPDGGTLAFYELDGTGSFTDIWMLSPAAKTPPRPFLETMFFEGGADFSPDGKWIAYTSNDSGRNEVYARPYPGPGPRLQISVNGGGSAVWGRNGQELFYMVGATADGVASTAMMAVRLNLQPTLRIGETTELFRGRYSITAPARSYDVTADGQGFLLVEQPERSLPPVTSLIVVQNWFEELKRLVPTN